MYIAFKWLFSMALAMWMMLCSIGFYEKNDVNKQLTTEINTLNNLIPLTKNASNKMYPNSFESAEKTNYRLQYNENIFLQCVMFFTGACMVLTYNKTNDIISYTHRKMKLLYKNEIIKKYLFKIIALKTAAKGYHSTLETIKVSARVTIIKFFKICVHVLKTLQISIKQSVWYRQNINLLLNKLNENGQKQTNLHKVLIATIKKNKNMRMPLETMSKTRLLTNIEDPLQQMKENRSLHVNFQQLYLITHQKNVLLKLQIKKLTQDKEDVLKKFNKLLNYVWHSNNNELKAYFSCFTVKSRNNLFNSNTKAEIEHFIKQSSNTKQELSDMQPKQILSFEINNLIKQNKNGERGLFAIDKDVPKLRGPGECVWTLKDKDGLIEKLYEYKTDFDNCDTIRKIRQYSVFYDKDCFLDFSSPMAYTHNTNVNLPKSSNQFTNINRITGSQSFQKFLENNKNIIIPRRMLSPRPLIY